MIRMKTSNNPDIDLTMQEWTTLSPANTPQLRKLRLSDPEAVQAARLTKRRRLLISELRSGVKISARAHVGVVHLGPLRITVQPKLRGLPLMHLLRYAFGLNNIELHNNATLPVSSSSFQDILILQLAAEAELILRRGARRDYQVRRERLQSPRGRIDFAGVVRNLAAPANGLACEHYPRNADCAPNRLLLAGLHFATRLTYDLDLRARLRRLAALLEDDVKQVALSHKLFGTYDRYASRLSAGYAPAVTLLKLLYAGAGVALQREDQRSPARGFLFNMNSFFQALLSRFLHENLTGCEVRDEVRLKHIYSYAGGSVRKRRRPAPRPDFVVTRGTDEIILDAKYRDLWNRSLPREMLYQLSVYALTNKSSQCAAILYPSLNASATEERIQIRDPLYAHKRAEVILRPVNLVELSVLIANTSGQVQCNHTFARQMAFGQMAFGIQNAAPY